MADYDNNMRGVAFANTYKKTDAHPSYRGTLEIDGVKYDQSIWIKVSKDGKKFLSFSYQPHKDYVQSDKPKSKPAPAIDDIDLDDSIPF